MEEHNSEGHSEQNEMLERREPTLGDYWRPLLNEKISRIKHQLIDANNFKMKLALISMV